MSIRVAARRFLYAVGGVLLAFVLCFGVAPHFLESMRLSGEASKALDALTGHGMESFRATPCQRKFTGIVVEGQVASADDAEEAEAVLRNAGIKADIWLAIHFPGAQLRGRFTGTRKRDPSQVRTKDRLMRGFPLPPQRPPAVAVGWPRGPRVKWSRRHVPENRRFDCHVGLA